MYHAEGTHEAIIPLAEWKAVQTEIERRAEQHRPKPPAQPSFFYTGRIQCAKCGKNFRRKTTAARVVWICATLNTKGKKHCASKQIPEATLQQVTAEVLGIKAFTREQLHSRVQSIRVCNGNILVPPAVPSRSEPHEMSLC